MATVLVLHRQQALTLPRFLVGAALCAYVVGIVVNSVFPIYLGVPDSGGSWTDHINSAPLQDTDTADYVMNVLLFMPLGVLLPLALPMRSSAAIAGSAFVLSLTIEALQLINAVTGQGGHIADVNDLLANTVGGLIGLIAARVITARPSMRPIVDRFAWPRAGFSQSRARPAE